MEAQPSAFAKYTATTYSQTLYSQASQGTLRSKDEVIKQIKQRHKNAKVLKISLNKQKTVYRVRVLMHSGKVRQLTVNARS